MKYLKIFSNKGSRWWMLIWHWKRSDCCMLMMLYKVTSTLLIRRNPMQPDVVQLFILQYSKSAFGSDWRATKSATKWIWTWRKRSSLSWNRYFLLVICFVYLWKWFRNVFHELNLLVAHMYCQMSLLQILGNYLVSSDWYWKKFHLFQFKNYFRNQSNNGTPYTNWIILYFGQFFS